ncbi:hypothetical protein [Sphingomonas arenae]|uniref:hypothetical protein n=1 Tax=Sphingomonas arenae TaxID=2812555 RepID=UPI001967C192|nr:hypothetical protein [Sphingomonas arenae]
MTAYRAPLFALLLIAAPAGAQVLAAGGSWAALQRPGGTCEAVARSELLAPKGEEQARVAIAFDRSGRRHGQLHARLSRPARGGAHAMLTIGTDQFLLVTRGSDAWSRGPAQEQAIIASLRRAPRMRLQWQGAGGRRYTDYYLLAGAATAIDAAAIGCAPPR